MSLGFSEVDFALKTTNFSAMPICDLYVKEKSGSCVLMEKPSFIVAAPVGIIVNDFSLLLADPPSDIFLDCWRKQVEKQGNKPLTFSQVVGDIWKPTIEQCMQLLDGLKERSLPLDEVDSLLEHYSNRLRILEEQLINLQKKICRVKRKQNPRTRWIPECVKRMKHYHHLRTHADVAEVFVTFRDRLGLLGDFSMVENLSRKVDGDDIFVYSCVPILLPSYLHDSFQRPFKAKL